VPKKTKHQPVHIDNATYELIKQYATAMEMPVTKAVAQMANDWIPTVGKAKVEMNKHFHSSLQEIVQQAKVLAFGSARESAAQAAAAGNPASR
jgi:hypothetical protein